MHGIIDIMIQTCSFMINITITTLVHTAHNNVLSQQKHALKLERALVAVNGVPQQVVMFLLVDATVIHIAKFLMTAAVMYRVCPLVVLVLVVSANVAHAVCNIDCIQHKLSV